MSFSMNEVFISYSYLKTILAGIITTLISGSGGEKTAIMGKNTSSDKAKSFYNLNKDMEDSIIKRFAKPGSEITECCRTWYIIQRDTGISAVASSIFLVMQPITELSH